MKILKNNPNRSSTSSYIMTPGKVRCRTYSFPKYLAGSGQVISIQLSRMGKEMQLNALIGTHLSFCRPSVVKLVA
jgi:hypothetical protein